jgi:hypothetical protein
MDYFLDKWEKAEKWLEHNNTTKISHLRFLD